MNNTLLAIREYFKNNNPGNVKLPFNQDGLSKEQIIKKTTLDTNDIEKKQVNLDMNKVKIITWVTLHIENIVVQLKVS